MPLKLRKGRLYYYKSIRQGDRVVSRYVGALADGQILAALDRLERERQEAAREDARRLREDLAERDAPVERFCKAVESLFRAEMEAAGYHRHKRGTWRMRRAKKTEIQKASDAPVPAVKRPRGPNLEEMRSICRRANEAENGDLEAGREFARLLETDWRETILRLNDGPDDNLAERLISLLGNGRVWEQATYRAHLEDLEQSLLSPDATPLERLLVKRIGLCWLAALEAERAEVANSREFSHRTFEMLQRRTQRAHDRFISAVKALAYIRKAAGKSSTLTASELTLRTVTETR